jgi:SulP family sulfate permease
MMHWRELRELRNFSFFYRAILLSTFAITVIFDLTVAVEVGLVLSSLFFIYRISSLTKVEPIALPPEIALLPDGKRVGAWRLFGSIFFGSVTKLENLLDPASPPPDVVILEMHQVINFDTTGMDALEALYTGLAKRGGRLIVVNPNEQPLSLMRRSGFLHDIGADHVFKTLDAALASLR